MTGKFLAIKTPRLLVAAVLASVTASVCCLGPFLLLATGLSGAWMSRVMLVEPFQPLLIAVSLLLILIAAWQLLLLRSCNSNLGAGSQTLNLKSYFTGFLLSFLVVVVLITSEYWIVLVAGL